MKRSEAVKIVAAKLNGRHKPTNLEEEISEVLKEFEFLGMLPPFVDKTFHPEGDYITLHVEQAVYNGNCEWEPEDLGPHKVLPVKDFDRLVDDLLEDKND